MLSPSSRLREYEVWGRIGGGGMSDVYLARHVDLCAPVVVKTLKLSVGSNADERVQRLRTEAIITSRIRSPRVVRPMDVGVTDDGTPYLVQDYVDGLDLAEFDAARRKALGVGLPLWYVCEVVAEVASGLAAAHRTGVLHRDLKPSNLFVSPEEGVQLGDFGVAVARGSAEGTPLMWATTRRSFASMERAGRWCPPTRAPPRGGTRWAWPPTETSGSPVRPGGCAASTAAARCPPRWGRPRISSATCRPSPGSCG